MQNLVTATSQPGDAVTIDGRRAKVLVRRQYGAVLVIQAGTPGRTRGNGKVLTDSEGSLYTYCFQTA